MTSTFRAVIFFAALSLVLGCEKSSSSEFFVKAKDSVNGMYSFDLILEDTVGTYDLSFFTRVDSPSESSCSACLRLDVEWRAPSGKFATEVVYMDVAELCEKYRCGFSPKENGKWKINVKVPEPPAGFCGLGMILEHNGTR